jgi:site-specific DNA recombinase
MQPSASTSPLILDSYARQSYVKKKARERRQGRNLSIEGQHAVNARRIEEYGATLGKKLQDVGKSAWDPNVKRKHWEELLSRVESGASNGVVIFDIERFLRRVKDAVRIVEMAEKGFIVLDSDQEYDLMSPAGRTSFYDAAVAAEGYSFRLSSRVKRGYNLMIAEGEWIGGRHRMFGFERDTTTVREEEAEHIRRAVSEILAGRRPHLVVNEFNELGLTTGSGAPWTLNTLRKLLQNPRLAGHIQRNGEIVGRLKGDPILEPTQWQQIVAWYEARRGRPHGGAYLCSGIVVCGCGNPISGARDTNRAKVVYDDGEPTRRYYCRKPEGCNRVIADQRVLDEHVKQIALGRLSDPQSVEQIKRRAQQEAKAREPIEAEVARLMGLQKYWGDRLNSGKITPEYHDAMVDDVAAKLSEQRAKLETMGAATVAPELEAHDDARLKWEASDGTQKREMLKRALVGCRIVVDPGSTRDVDLRDRIRVEPVPGPRAV